MAKNKINKHQLVEASFNLFLKNGYFRTSIQDIADALDVSKATMYHYVRSKEELLEATFYYSKIKFFEGWYYNWGRGKKPTEEPNIAYLVFLIKMKFERMGNKKICNLLDEMIGQIHLEIQEKYDLGDLYLDIINSI